MSSSAFVFACQLLAACAITAPFPGTKPAIPAT